MSDFNNIQSFQQSIPKQGPLTPAKAMMAEIRIRLQSGNNRLIEAKLFRGEDKNLDLRDLKNIAARQMNPESVSYKKIRGVLLKSLAPSRATDPQNKIQVDKYQTLTVDQKTVKSKAREVAAELLEAYEKGEFDSNLVKNRTTEAFIEFSAGANIGLMEIAQKEFPKMINEEVTSIDNERFVTLFTLVGDINKKGIERAEDKEWIGLLNEIQQMPEGRDRRVAVEHLLSTKLLGVGQEDLGQRIEDANKARIKSLPFVDALSRRVDKEPSQFNRQVLKEAIQKLTMDSGKIEKNLAIQRIREEKVNDIRKGDCIIYKETIYKITKKQKIKSANLMIMKPVYEGSEKKYKFTLKGKKMCLAADMAPYIRGKIEIGDDRVSKFRESYEKLRIQAERHNFSELSGSIQKTLTAFQ
jgi:hypothetical protein